MKILIPGFLVVLVLLSGCITGKTASDSSEYPVLNETTGPAYEYNPTKYLPGWNLTNEIKRIADMPLESGEKFKEQNVLDAATWELQKGNETLFVWTRVYETPEDLQNSTGTFTSMFAWRTRDTLGFGDEGIIGIYRVQGENDPLLLWVANDTLMLYISYYNDNGKYNATNMFDDQRFLVGLAKDILNK